MFSSCVWLVREDECRKSLPASESQCVGQREPAVDATPRPRAPVWDERDRFVQRSFAGRPRSRFVRLLSAKTTVRAIGLLKKHRLRNRLSPAIHELTRVRL